MREVFAPMVSGFADFNAGYNGTMFVKLQSSMQFPEVTDMSSPQLKN